MCGLIWMVQLVHYPSFAYVQADRYREFQTFHMLRISWIVIPVMVVEIITGCILYLLHPTTAWTVNIALLILIWVSTLALQMPKHSTLENGKNEQIIEKLIRGNWIRTALWSSRAILLLNLLAENAKA